MKVLKISAENWPQLKAAPTNPVLTTLAAAQATTSLSAMPRMNMSTSLTTKSLSDTSAEPDEAKRLLTFKKVFVLLAIILWLQTSGETDAPALRNLLNVIWVTKPELNLVPKTALPNTTNVKVARMSELTPPARPVMPALSRTAPTNITSPDVPQNLPTSRIVHGNANS